MSLWCCGGVSVLRCGHVKLSFHQVNPLTKFSVDALCVDVLPFRWQENSVGGSITIEILLYSKYPLPIFLMTTVKVIKT